MLRYLFAVNAVGAITVLVDKLSARLGWWRVSEWALCVVALGGGWPAMLCCMKAMTHKTRKSSFQVKFYVACLCNVLLVCFMWY